MRLQPRAGIPFQRSGLSAAPLRVRWVTMRHAALRLVGVGGAARGAVLRLEASRDYAVEACTVHRIVLHSQPPVNPALRSPAVTAGQVRMMSQMRPDR